MHWLHFCWPAAGTRSSSSCGPTTTTSGSSGPATSTSSSSGPAITGLSPDDEGKTGPSFVLLTLGQTITVALRAKDKGGVVERTGASLSSITQDNIGGHPAIKS